MIVQEVEVMVVENWWGVVVALEEHNKDNAKDMVFLNSHNVFSQVFLFIFNLDDINILFNLFRNVGHRLGTYMDYSNS